MYFQTARKGFNSSGKRKHYPAQWIVKIKVDIFRGATLGYILLLCIKLKCEMHSDILEEQEYLPTTFFFSGQAKVISFTSIPVVDSYIVIYQVCEYLQIRTFIIQKKWLIVWLTEVWKSHMNIWKYIISNYK